MGFRVVRATGLGERLAHRVMRRPRLSLTAVTAALVLAALLMVVLATTGIVSDSLASTTLVRAPTKARKALAALVAEAQDQGRLTVGDTERAAALVHDLTHGALGLSPAGRLFPDTGRTDPEGLVDDLLT